MEGSDPSGPPERSSSVQVHANWLWTLASVHSFPVHIQLLFHLFLLHFSFSLLRVTLQHLSVINHELPIASARPLLKSCILAFGALYETCIPCVTLLPQPQVRHDSLSKPPYVKSESKEFSCMGAYSPTGLGCCTK